MNRSPIVFSEVRRRPEEHKKRLADAIRASVRSLDLLEFDKWLLPLSGGYDSRGILCFLNEEIGIPPSLTTVTWGFAGSENRPQGEADIAKRLARSFGVKHRFCEVDLSSEPVEMVVERFLSCGEGRIDHIAGYVDGLDMWRQFEAQGIAGVIRGDHGFGWKGRSSESSTRVSLGCGLCSDFKNLNNVIEQFGFAPQELPPELQKAGSESEDGWRDRIHHSYRLPTVLAALSDLKYSYVEVINPLLSKRVLDVVRSLPGDLRTDKYLFKKLVAEMGPDLGFSNPKANASGPDIFRDPRFVKLLDMEMESEYARRLLGDDFIKMVRNGIQSKARRPRGYRQHASKMGKRIMPGFMKSFVRDRFAKPEIDGNVLAFRVFTIVRMHKMLTADAGRLGVSRNV